MNVSSLSFFIVTGCSNTGSILWVVPLYLFMGRDGAGLVPWSSCKDFNSFFLFLMNRFDLVKLS